MERTIRSRLLARLALVGACLAALCLCGAAAAASAPPGSSVICAQCGDTGTGWTGCTSQTASHSANLSLLASVRHFLVVNYCKQSGTITSVSFAHGCDAGGLVSCSTGAAWQTGGGVGYGYATFEAHASWLVHLPPFLNNYDTLTLTIPVG
jgi:hypothetical protein